MSIECFDCSMKHCRECEHKSTRPSFKEFDEHSDLLSRGYTLKPIKCPTCGVMGLYEDAKGAFCINHDCNAIFEVTYD